MIGITVDGDTATIANDGDALVELELVAGFVRGGHIELEPGEAKERKIRDVEKLATSPAFGYITIADEVDDGLRVRQEEDAGVGPEPSQSGDAEQQSPVIAENGTARPAAVTGAYKGPQPRTAWIATARAPVGAHNPRSVPGLPYPLLTLVHYAKAVELVSAGKAVRIDNPNNRRVIPLWGEE